MDEPLLTIGQVAAREGVRTSRILKLGSTIVPARLARLVAEGVVSQRTAAGRVLGASSVLASPGGRCG